MSRKTLEWGAWVLIIVGGILLAMVGSAYAMQTPQDPQLPIPGLPAAKLGGSWWAGLLVGIMGGIQAVFVGMMKKSSELGAVPSLNYKLLVKTLVIGIGVGMVAHLMKWSPSDAAGWLITAPMGGVVTAGIEDLINLIWKKLSPPKPLAS